MALSSEKEPSSDTLYYVDVDDLRPRYAVLAGLARADMTPAQKARVLDAILDVILQLTGTIQCVAKARAHQFRAEIRRLEECRMCFRDLGRPLQ